MSFASQRRTRSSISKEKEQKEEEEKPKEQEKHSKKPLRSFSRYIILYYIPSLFLSFYIHFFHFFKKHEIINQ